MKRIALVACLGSAQAHATPFDPYAFPRPPKPLEATTAKPYTGLGADSVPPELIAKFAPPPLDPAVSRRIQALLDVRGSGGGVITAKGDLSRTSSSIARCSSSSRPSTRSARCTARRCGRICAPPGSSWDL